MVSVPTSPAPADVAKQRHAREVELRTRDVGQRLRHDCGHGQRHDDVLDAFGRCKEPAVERLQPQRGASDRAGRHVRHSALNWRTELGAPAVSDRRHRRRSLQEIP